VRTSRRLLVSLVHALTHISVLVGTSTGIAILGATTAAGTRLRLGYCEHALPALPQDASVSGVACLLTQIHRELSYLVCVSVWASSNSRAKSLLLIYKLSLNRSSCTLLQTLRVDFLLLSMNAYERQGEVCLLLTGDDCSIHKYCFTHKTATFALVERALTSDWDLSAGFATRVLAVPTATDCHVVFGTSNGFIIRTTDILKVQPGGVRVLLDGPITSLARLDNEEIVIGVGMGYACLMSALAPGGVDTLPPLPRLLPGAFQHDSVQAVACADVTLDGAHDVVVGFYDGTVLLVRNEQHSVSPSNARSPSARGYHQVCKKRLPFPVYGVHAGVLRSEHALVACKEEAGLQARTMELAVITSRSAHVLSFVEDPSSALGQPQLQPPEQAASRPRTQEKIRELREALRLLADAIQSERPPW
jgi:hypothetical protein